MTLARATRSALAMCRAREFGEVVGEDPFALIVAEFAEPVGGFFAITIPHQITLGREALKVFPQ